MLLYRQRQPSLAHPTQLSGEHIISEPFDATRRDRKEVAQELGLTKGQGGKAKDALDAYLAPANMNGKRSLSPSKGDGGGDSDSGGGVVKKS